MEEWDRYFRKLLGGVEWRVRKRMEGGWRDDGEEGIRREEVKEVIRKLREGKAMGGGRHAE